MSNPKIYICGEGHLKNNPDWEKIKKRLKALKCTVIDPSGKAYPDMGWTDALENRMEMVKNSQVLYILPNWRENVMSRIELTVAMDLHKHTIFHPATIK